MLGIEGLRLSAEKAQVPVIVADLEERVVKILGVDLVWCCEVVEHVNNVENIIDTISVGKILAMTHATPKQSGYHHVNCQPAEYWITRLSKKGMIYQEELTKHAKSLCPSSGNHFGWHGLIFVRS